MLQARGYTSVEDHPTTQSTRARRPPARYNDYLHYKYLVRIQELGREHYDIVVMANGHTHAYTCRYSHDCACHFIFSGLANTTSNPIGVVGGRCWVATKWWRF